MRGGNPDRLRVAVIGSTGQLGTDLVEVLHHAKSYEVFPLSHAEVECTESASVHRALSKIRPDVVVHCAAFVRVDECENRLEEAFRVNALGTLHVARACEELGALCVYISTDYVFDGEKGESYTEEDTPRPVNVYGASKVAGEYAVQQSNSKWLIVRTASLFGRAGSRGKGGNFVDTIVGRAKAGGPLRVVSDIRMSPTYTYDAALGLERSLQRRDSGFLHLTNAGSCTWYEFARKILDLAGLDAELEPITSSDYSTKARRPKNSSLRSVRLSENDVRSWHEGLRAYLVEKGHIQS